MMYSYNCRGRSTSFCCLEVNFVIVAAERERPVRDSSEDQVVMICSVYSLSHKTPSPLGFL